MVNASFFLLICGLLAGAATALAPGAPLDRLLPLLALLLGGCGLVMLYRALLVPAKKLERDLRGMNADTPRARDAAYGALRPVAEAVSAHTAELRRKRAQARRDAEDAAQSLEEWREKYNLMLAGQQLIRENLADSAKRTRALSGELSRLLRAMSETAPDAAPDSHATLSRRARGANTLVEQFLKKFDSDLEFLNSCLSQVEKFTDGAQTGR